jgi:GNAT superfamily N-acetyltransferase
MSSEWHKDGFTISTDPGRLDVDLIHRFLTTESYWAQHRTLPTVKLAVQNSLNFGVYEDDRQIGFARVVTDYATFAWLADVFIIADYRRRGLSKWLLQIVVAHPRLQGLRRWMLATRDAHELYRQFGFQDLQDSNSWMTRFEA